MTNDNEADRAIAELNGTELAGRALNVSEARSKGAGASGVGYGGRGGGYGGQRRNRF